MAKYKNGIWMLVLIIVIGLSIYLLFFGKKTIQPSMISKEWNITYNSITDVASGCDSFPSLEAAHGRFRLPGDWMECKGDRNRWIIFYHEDNVEGYLTCKQVEANKYICCTIVARGGFPDIDAWKRICT